MSTSSSEVIEVEEQEETVVKQILIVEEDEQDEEGQPLKSWREKHSIGGSSNEDLSDLSDLSDDDDDDNNNNSNDHDDEKQHTHDDNDEDEDEGDDIVIDEEHDRLVQQQKLESLSESEKEVLRMEEYKKTRSSNAAIFDEYGFELPEGELPKIPTPEEQEVILRRVEKWETMLKDWPTWMKKKKKKVRERCRKGIPNTVRGRAWQVMSGSHLMMETYPHTFQIILGEETNLKDIDTIERDLDRTYPDHYEFMDQDGRGQNKLFNVLKAFTHYRPKTGYVQGMAMLVGLMLMYMSEEEAFWLMVTLNDNYVPGLFDRSLSQYHVDMGIFRELLASRLPKLNDHLDSNGIHPSLYITKWIFCLFTVSLPWETVLRFWDVFLFEGMRWFFTVAVACMTILEDALLEYNTEGLMMTLQHATESMTTDQLFEVADQVNISHKELERIHAKVLKEFQGDEPDTFG